jgi:phosphate transport system substrate-binding protein
MKAYFNISILVLLFSLSSCGEKKKTGETQTYTSGRIKIAVDETFEPIVKEELEVYHALTPSATITPIYTTETEAINLFVKDSVRFAIATRPLSDKETKSLNNKKLYPRSIKIATDGIALIVNRSNPDTLISVAELKKVLQGQATTWKEIYPSSKLGNLQLVFDNNNSSTIRYAIDSICKGNALNSKVLYAKNSNEEVIKFVSETPNAIGVIGVNWLGDKSDSTNLTFNDKIRVMSVSKEYPATPSNSVKPFQAYLLYGDYPLVRTVYVLLNDPVGALPSGLTTFFTGDKGQRIILKSALVPATQTLRVVHVNKE